MQSFPQRASFRPSKLPQVGRVMMQSKYSASNQFQDLQNNLMRQQENDNSFDQSLFNDQSSILVDGVLYSFQTSLFAQRESIQRQTLSGLKSSQKIIDQNVTFEADQNMNYECQNPQFHSLEEIMEEDSEDNLGQVAKTEVVGGNGIFQVKHDITNKSRRYLSIAPVSLRNSYFLDQNLPFGNQEQNQNISTQQQQNIAIFNFNYVIEDFPLEKKYIIEILDQYYPMYIGFLRLRKEHYNTAAIRKNYMRIYDKYTQVMIGFLVPAFDFDDPQEWEKYENF
eukprot:403333109